MYIQIDQLMLFMAAGILLNLTPGPDMIYVATRSASQGRKAGILSALGIGTGTFFHILAAALGLSTILMYSATAFEVVKWIGAGYLVYLGFKAIIDKKTESKTARPKTQSLSKIYLQGCLTNILNPKVALFFLAFLPQFTNPESGDLTLQIIFLGLLFDTTGTIVNSIVAFLADKVSGLLNKNGKVQKIQSWFSGIVFISLGISLALSEES
ncbi:MAG: LysE family translocator [Ignavibacteria bacterium]